MQNKQNKQNKKDVDLRDRAVRAYAVYAQPVGMNYKSKCSTELPVNSTPRPKIKYLGEMPLDALRTSRMEKCSTKRQTEREKMVNQHRKI